MQHVIRQTNKGYLITLTNNRKRVNYFLRDESHILESYIFDILNLNRFTLGKPFGNNIYPIYITELPKPRLPEHNYKTRAIWRHYRDLVLSNDKPKMIKKYAHEMRTQLDLLGVDRLYELIIQEQVISSTLNNLVLL